MSVQTSGSTKRGLTRGTAFLWRISNSFGKGLVKASKDSSSRFLTGLELAGAFAVWHGIYSWSAPAAWIVAGLAVIVAVELRG